MARGRATPGLVRVVLRRDDAFDATRFPFNVPAIASIRTIAITSRVLCFVGENGSGKSTLLEALAIACGFGAEGGTRNFLLSTRSESPDDDRRPDAPLEQLADALQLRWSTRQSDGFFLRAESFFNVATYLDRLGPEALRSYGGKSLHARSHGESFLTLFLARFSGNGLYLLDEPEAALSAARQLALMVRMRDLLERHPLTQFVIATHSPILLGFPGAQILSFDDGAVREIAYRNTDAYVVTRRFLDNPERALSELFASDGDGEDVARVSASPRPPPRAPRRTRRR
ncbi:MAG TPA: AAA family ATPase [Candidatus Elarobacter sp.]|jgi:predicted ATPase|nr:AAA family ATPase [Candidatus Elarobacter sp.]